MMGSSPVDVNKSSGFSSAIPGSQVVNVWLAVQAVVILLNPFAESVTSLLFAITKFCAVFYIASIVKPDLVISTTLDAEFLDLHSFLHISWSKGSLVNVWLAVQAVVILCNPFAEVVAFLLVAMVAITKDLKAPSIEINKQLAIPIEDGVLRLFFDFSKYSFRKQWSRVWKVRNDWTVPGGVTVLYVSELGIVCLVGKMSNGCVEGCGSSGVVLIDIPDPGGVTVLCVSVLGIVGSGLVGFQWSEVPGGVTVLCVSVSGIVCLVGKMGNGCVEVVEAAETAVIFDILNLLIASSNPHQISSILGRILYTMTRNRRQQNWGLDVILTFFRLITDSLSRVLNSTLATKYEGCVRCGPTPNDKVDDSHASLMFVFPKASLFFKRICSMSSRSSKYQYQSSRVFSLVFFFISKHFTIPSKISYALTVHRLSRLSPGI
ncbi:hypothetical protein CR513_26036, partial [Mucuna pruriens]